MAAVLNTKISTQTNWLITNSTFEKYDMVGPNYKEDKRLISEKERERERERKREREKD